MQNEPFSGHYLVLAIIAFFVASYLHEQIDLAPQLAHRRPALPGARHLFGWAIFVAIIVLIGYATGYAYLYSERVIGSWFCITPFMLLA
ncbi:hypothetical protein LP419_06530 [Massilia sp. H-1]|nr:hypothetical protein LP419_06530 [Massilia sp. H-1]